MQELIKDTLYSFDEKIRVELGPQIVELDCNDKTLHNSITHANYQEGRVDAYGKVITKGSKMHCVDWKENLSKKLWKVYQLQEDKLGMERFIKIKEFEDKKKALSFAEETLKGVK